MASYCVRPARPRDGRVGTETPLRLDMRFASSQPESRCKKYGRGKLQEPVCSTSPHCNAHCNAHCNVKEICLR